MLSNHTYENAISTVCDYFLPPHPLTLPVVSMELLLSHEMAESIKPSTYQRGGGGGGGGAGPRSKNNDTDMRHKFQIKC